MTDLKDSFLFFIIKNIALLIFLILLAIIVGSL